MGDGRHNSHVNPYGAKSGRFASKEVMDVTIQEVFGLVEEE